MEGRFGLLAELLAQPKDGLGVQLAHSGFGDTDDFTDFLEGHILVVIQCYQELFPFRQRRDGLGQALAKLTGFVFPLGIRAIFVFHGVNHGDGAAAGVIAEGVIEGEHQVVAFGQHQLNLVFRDAQFSGQFFIVGLSAEAFFQTDHGFGEIPGPFADASGNPVLEAELVDDGAADAGDGVGFKLEAPIDIKAFDGFHEAEGAVADQIFLGNADGEGDGEAADHVPHEVQVVDNQFFPQLLIVGGFFIRSPNRRNILGDADIVAAFGRGCFLERFSDL